MNWRCANRLLPSPILLFHHLFFVLRLVLLSFLPGLAASRAFSLSLTNLAAPPSHRHLFSFALPSHPPIAIISILSSIIILPEDVPGYVSILRRYFYNCFQRVSFTFLFPFTRSLASSSFTLSYGRSSLRFWNMEPAFFSLRYPNNRNPVHILRHSVSTNDETSEDHDAHTRKNLYMYVFDRFDALRLSKHQSARIRVHCNESLGNTNCEPDKKSVG